MDAAPPDAGEATDDEFDAIRLAGVEGVSADECRCCCCCCCGVDAVADAFLVVVVVVVVVVFVRGVLAVQGSACAGFDEFLVELGKLLLLLLLLLTLKLELLFVVEKVPLVDEDKDEGNMCWG